MMANVSHVMTIARCAKKPLTNCAAISKHGRSTVITVVKSSNFLNNVRRFSSDTNSSKEDPPFDIIIAGGGMVGTTLACSLAKNPLLREKKIILLEGAAEKRFELKEKYSNRVSALNSSTKKLLEQIGAWQHIEAARLCPVKKMQVWEATSDAAISFNNHMLEKPVAYIVENDVLLGAVYQQLSETATEVRYSSQIESCDLNQPDKLPQVTLKTGEKMRCKLLIGADGANSKVRSTMGGQYINWSYDQMGVVATLRLSEPTENVVAWQRFLPTGPIAILPLTSELSSLVWSLPIEQAKQILQLPKDSFIDAVNDGLWKQYPQHSKAKEATQKLSEALANFLPGSVAPGIQQLQPTIINEEDNSRAAFPLGFGHATLYARRGAVLVGDAAHRVHPLAGQGVNLGFGDIQCLVSLLADSVQNGAQLGTLKPLLDYEKARQRHNVPLMLGVDVLHRLYTNQSQIAAFARGLSLTIVNAFPPVKGFFSKYAAT